MKNKIIIGIFLLSLILGAAAAALQKNIKLGFTVFVAPGAEKILLNGKALGRSKFSDNAQCRLANNEYESFQIIAQNGKSALKGLRLELSDLVNPANKDKIDKNNLHYRFVGFVKTKKPYYKTEFVGMWPDYLMPLEKMDVGAGVTQPIWVTVYAPSGTPAGTYQGKIKVIADENQEKEIYITVKVWNFTLPLESHLKTAFDLYPHVLNDRYPPVKDETREARGRRLEKIRDEYYVDMLKYRLNPILNIDPASDDFKKRMEKLRAYGLNNFAIGTRSGSTGNNWPTATQEIEDLIPLYREYAKILRSQGLLDKSYIYAWDEGKIGNPTVKIITQTIHRADPGLKNMVCYHGFWDPDKDPEWGKDIDIWCFQIEDYNERLKNKLENLGIEIWMYVSGPGGKYPNLAIDFPAIDPRVLPWMCWKYNIKGLLYWCVNYWTVDPYQSAANTQWAQNGNGLLYYPGENGPVPSLRLELLRDGLEDYEYLFILGEKIKQLEAKEINPALKAAVDRAKSLLDIDGSIVNSFTDYTDNPELIYKRRAVIAETIEALDKVR